MEIKYRFFNVNSDSEVIQWLDLYQICFQTTVSREFWHWIHEENPFYIDTKPLIFIAEIDNKIVGSVSLIPSPLEVVENQERCLLNSCLVCKAMVHPEYRGRGIFSTLLKNAKHFTRKEGYDLLITFSNNSYSYQSFLHAGFFYVSEIVQSKYYISADGQLRNFTAVLPAQIGRKIIDSLLSLSSLLIPNIPHSFEIQYGNVADSIEEIDGIYSSNRTISGIYGSRTPRFIRWRLSYEGIHFKCLTLRDDKKKMLAYIIIEFPDNKKSALIIDLYSQKGDESLILILVREAIVILKKDNITSIWTYLLDRNGAYSRVFSIRHGFVSRSSVAGKKLKPRLLYYVLKDQLCRVDFSDKNQWNIQSIDTCMFWVN